MICESIRVFSMEFSIASFSTIVFSSVMVISELLSCFFKCSTSAGCAGVGVGGLADTTAWTLLELEFGVFHNEIFSLISDFSQLNFTFISSNKPRHNYKLSPGEWRTENCTESGRINREVQVVSMTHQKR